MPPGRPCGAARSISPQRCGVTRSAATSTPQDVITFAAPGAEAGRLLRREYQARREAGIEGSWLSPAVVARETASRECRRDPDTGDGDRSLSRVPRFDRCRGHRAGPGCTSAQRCGGSEPRSGTSRSSTAGGTVRAESVVVATGSPIQDLRGLRRHLRPEHVYGVVTDAAAGRDPAAGGATPRHSGAGCRTRPRGPLAGRRPRLRPWRAAGRSP